MSEQLREDFGIIDFLNDPGRGAKLLPDFLKSAENVNGLINAIIPEIQELHDAQSDVYSLINIFEAVGLQLDNIYGEILNTPRLTGQTDDDYRADLLIAFAKSVRSGEISAMKAAYKDLADTTNALLFEQNPASFSMQANVSVIPDASGLARIRDVLTELKQGGNTMILSITDSATPFTLGTGSPSLGLTGILSEVKRWNGGEFGHEVHPFTLGSDGALSPLGLSGDYLSVENISGGTLSKGF